MAATTTTRTPSGRQYAIRGVGSTAPPTTQQPRTGAVSDDESRFLSRWLKVWVALLAVVTLVVVVYLIAITNSLAAINGNLATADTAVTGAGGDTASLPDQVQNINASLGAIDPALAPIPGQADQIIGLLSSIDTSLADTDSSLINTSSSLQNTSGQLGDTSGVLQTVLGQAGAIREDLFQADQPNGPCGPDSCSDQNQLGVANIHQRVAIANNVLIPAEGDATDIVAGLSNTNSSLSSICNNPIVGLVGALGGGNCP